MTLLAFPPQTPMEKRNGEGRQSGKPSAVIGPISVGFKIRKSGVQIPVLMMLAWECLSNLLNLSTLRFSHLSEGK